MVVDNLEFFSNSPWLVPMGEVKVICSDEFYDYINKIEEASIRFNRVPIDQKALLGKGISNNILFKSSIKKERRKIDWKKFFTLEIGKSKKKV